MYKILVFLINQCNLFIHIRFRGQRLPVLKRDCVPGPKIYNDILVKQRAPMYSMSYRHPIKEICRSPGPKYNLKFGKTTPIYSFGMKHSECAPPYFIECDDQC